MEIVITGATIIDGASDDPVTGHGIWIVGDRIKAVLPEAELTGLENVTRLEVDGRFVIPGLMNANVHLWGGCFSAGNLLRYYDRYEALIAEAAQVALRNGLTTVFDTLGPRRPLMAVRDRIARGETEGARIFIAGWIVGLDGILSLDFNPNGASILSADMVQRINGLCAENVGPALSWMEPAQVVDEVLAYIGKGIDFIKYASNEHRWGDPTTSLIFSPRIQQAMVEAVREAGLTVQAHCSSIESLRIATEAGCDLIQHANITGPYPIPPDLLELIAERDTGTVLFPFTQRRFDWIMANCEIDRTYFAASDDNCRNLLASGAKLMLGNDGGVWGPELASDPRRQKFWLAPGEDNLSDLGTGHFAWLRAMEEKGMRPMELLRAATRNIAEAYGKGDEVGTLEPGKSADMLILDADPLQSAAHYSSIHAILKAGRVVDREALPEHPILDVGLSPVSEEMAAYQAHRHVGRSAFPICPCCIEP